MGVWGYGYKRVCQISIIAFQDYINLASAGGVFSQFRGFEFLNFPSRVGPKHGGASYVNGYSQNVTSDCFKIYMPPTATQTCLCIV